MSKLKRREKLQLLLLTFIGMIIILLVVVVACLFRIYSLQKQVASLKEAKIEKEQVEADSAGAGDTDVTVSQAENEEEASDNNMSDAADESISVEEPDEAAQEKDTDTGDAEEENNTAAESTSAPEDEGSIRHVYLTFDDGPSSNTDRILEILEAYNVKATFFVTGREDEASIESYKKIVNAGHEIAMHSYSHDYTYIYASVENFTADLEKIQTLLTQVTGRTPTIYRFPGGSSNTLSVRKLPMQDFVDVLDERGITYFDWNVDSTDGAGANRPVEELLENVKKNLGRTDTSVILLHDASDHDTTVDALPQIIQYCLDEGYEFDVITEDTPVVHHNLAD